jgi:hypothetical protein
MHGGHGLLCRNFSESPYIICGLTLEFVKITYITLPRNLGLIGIPRKDRGMIDRAEMIVLDKGRCGHRHSKNQSLARLGERKRRVAGAPHFFPHRF